MLVSHRHCTHCYWAGPALCLPGCLPGLFEIIAKGRNSSSHRPWWHPGKAGTQYRERCTRQLLCLQSHPDTSRSRNRLCSQRFVRQNRKRTKVQGDAGPVLLKELCSAALTTAWLLPSGQMARLSVSAQLHATEHRHFPGARSKHVLFMSVRVIKIGLCRGNWIFCVSVKMAGTKNRKLWNHIWMWEYISHPS